MNEVFEVQVKDDNNQPRIFIKINLQNSDLCKAYNNKLTEEKVAKFANWFCNEYEK